MRLFRDTIETCRESGAMIYFHPVRHYVPRAWVERMAEFEWECEEKGGCSHPAIRAAGCYNGADLEGCWVCRALLVDPSVHDLSFEQLLHNIRNPYN